MNVTKELLKWVKVKNLPYWEQYALDLIVDGREITAKDIEHMGECLLEDARVTNNKTKRFKLEALEKAAALEDNKSADKILLMAISDTQNINALVDGQQLEFDEHLTIIYGANGTGKSGYGRLFGNACFTRGDQEILHNISNPKSKFIEKQATFHLKAKDGDRIIPFKIGSKYAELKQFYVHDTKSISTHLTQENEFKFSPMGLGYLTQLAKTCDDVCDYLENRIINWTKDNEFGERFMGESQVTARVETLSTQTDIDDLQKLATLNEPDTDRKALLQKEIAKYRSLNIPTEIKAAQRKMQDLQILIRKIDALVENIGMETSKQIRRIAQQYISAKTQAEATGASSFKNELFPRIGSDSWQHFIYQAHKLSHEDEDTIYPKKGDYCLLCHQQLHETAIHLFEKYWNFLKDDSKQKMESCEVELREINSNLERLDLGFFEEGSSVYQFLTEEYPTEHKHVVAFVRSAKNLHAQLLKTTTTKVCGTFLPLRPVPAKLLQEIVEGLAKQVEALHKADPVKEINVREIELRNLEHREILAKSIKQISEFVIHLRMADLAAKAKPSTNHISMFQQSLFNQLVTKKYVDIFKDNLKRLGRALPVEIKTSNTKGTPLKQLFVHRGEYSPTRILSEGEKRIASLADFLTEATLDESSCGIVLDDPVTSLDIEWKEAVANRLVSEAKTRQTIIFTHDLHFVFLLRQFADQLEVSSMVHWIVKAAESSPPGQVYLNNSPASEKDYKTDKHAKTYLDKAKTAAPQDQEQILKSGFAAMRTSYEALVIYELFAGVVERFQERTRGDLLENVILKKDIFIQVKEKLGLLSRYMEGHLHSDDFGGKKPNIEMLRKEIEEFNILKGEIRGLRTK